MTRTIRVAMSETCNAYRYTLIGAREGSDGEFAFKAEENEPNPGCNFIPQYSDVNVRWVLNPQ